MSKKKLTAEEVLEIVQSTLDKIVERLSEIEDKYGEREDRSLHRDKDFIMNANIVLDGAYKGKVDPKVAQDELFRVMKKYHILQIKADLRRGW